MNQFEAKHIGTNSAQENEMLKVIGVQNTNQLIEETIPKSIMRDEVMDLPSAQTEFEYLQHIKHLATKNKAFKSFIGQGYYQSITPPVIQRNIFENPGWYTQYTPYQAEIAQGRLEALLNFQTVISDLTGLPIANASLLDEGTAAAEAMSMFFSQKNKRAKNGLIKKCFVDESIFESSLNVLKTRATPLNIELVVGDYRSANLDPTEFFAAIVQYPNAKGYIEDYREFASDLNESGIPLTVIADIMALSIISPPGEWGAEAVVGNTQRFGIPLGYGGPHAAYFATTDKYKRQIPGRIIGISENRHGKPAYRMALQTREQHIRREKATSNICTAQALLAIMAGMYAVNHGPEGIKKIALDIYNKTISLANSLKASDFAVSSLDVFDTLRIELSETQITEIKSNAIGQKINFHYEKEAIQISIDETTSLEDLQKIAACFDCDFTYKNRSITDVKLSRSSVFFDHEVFHLHRTETKLMRYIKSLENKDLSLVHSMIALGSCTMKLNPAATLMPLSWSEFGQVHPLAPQDQNEGYIEILQNLEKYLCQITGFDACSLQPNSGAQGEYAGLLTIKNYHLANGHKDRDIVLIPSSAHGTNPASAVMSGFKVVVVQCDDEGNIDIEDLKNKVILHSEKLGGLMVTYPSTHGVFEEEIKQICSLIHDHGGLVYMDGANMNAQVGLTSPADIGTDVCHLNLHKTFSIPHGGGGPGMGPICCTKALAPYLPGHFYLENKNGAVSSAPYGSASILLISYGYIRMLGTSGLTNATKIAILNANYIKALLEPHYPILYKGKNGHCAHELIVDLRQFKKLDISAEDVAKRLIDYGYHAPTMSFPVAGTIMIEPTESEDKNEIDHFCAALISIKKEIDEIALGEASQENNVLVNAPHILSEVASSHWEYPYSREKAAFPFGESQKNQKFWPATSRVDNAKGDRNLICTCPPMEAYENI